MGCLFSNLSTLSAANIATFSEEDAVGADAILQDYIAPSFHRIVSKISLHNQAL
jgi:hypothetical protein